MPKRPGPRFLLRVAGRRLPRTRGALRVRGLHGSVRIARDRWGIPHVRADGDADAWFGLGFCHGQDRAFQLELLARAGRGTLSELLGGGALPIDRLSRTLGFRRLAVAQLPMLDPAVLAGITAYVAGINAAAASSPRPHELLLLRARRSRWEETDVLAFQGLQSLSLAGNWDSELARLQILMADGPGALAAADPSYDPWLPAVTPVGSAAGPVLDRLASDAARLRELVGGRGASNAWAVAGSRTASGSPILANDPHLSPAVPAPWYLAHLQAPGWSVAGASFVGGPAFPTGFNGTMAWGITAGCTDSADLFWEELSPDGATVRGPGGPEPVQRLREEIVVRGADTVVEEILITERGPLLTPVLDGVPAALSIRATWLQPAPVRGFLDLHRAVDFESFRRAFAEWPGPALNVVYADVAGHIGWQLVGTLPIRRSGNGTLPAPAWEVGWEEAALPYDALPWILDPDEGFVVSANNAPRADRPDAPFLGVDWLDGYRAQRIVETLAGRAGWDVPATAGLQGDVTSLPWGELRELILGAPTHEDEVRLAVDLLTDWDGELAADSRAAAVFELAVADIAASIAGRQAPRSWRWSLGAGFGGAVTRTGFGARFMSHLVSSLRGATDAGPVVADGLRAAIRLLTDRFGPDPAGWSWGTVRPLTLRHALGPNRALASIFNVGPVPIGGDANTVAQAGVQPLKPLANPAAIANQRSVIDLADPDESRFVLAGGQSGNPLSPHYADLFELWRRGEGVAIAWSEEAVTAATVATLTLRPRD